MRFFWKTIEPGAATTTQRPAAILVSIIAMLLAFAVIATISMAGFWEGWRAGWFLARGEGLAKVTDLRQSRRPENREPLKAVVMSRLKQPLIQWP
jgi:hypothetical protein